MAETMVASSVKADHSSRKNKKPLMEKRRRARINSCLAQLKSLVLQAIKKDSSQFSKLEKADILELTVKHLRALQRQQAAGVLTQDTTVVSKYRAGFNECAKEVVRYMGSVREVNEEVKERVVGHLANCLQVVNQITPMESLQQQQQQQLKPLHVHIPPQQQHQQVINGSVAPSVIMHTAAVSQPSAVMGGGGYTLAPRPLAASSPQEGHTPSSSSSSSPAAASATTTTQLSALPLQSAAMTTGAATTVVSPACSISGAFKLVPSGSGAVAVYVGTSSGASVSVPLPRDALSVVDALPLYSVALPPNHHHPTPALAAAFVAPSPPTSSRLGGSALDCRYEDVSPVKAEYSPLSAAAAASLPVDLRQVSRSKAFEECPSSYHPHSSAMSTGHCSPAMADEKLWRPW